MCKNQETDGCCKTLWPSSGLLCISKMPKVTCATKKQNRYGRHTAHQRVFRNLDGAPWVSSVFNLLMDFVLLFRRCARIHFINACCVTQWAGQTGTICTLRCLTIGLENTPYLSSRCFGNIVGEQGMPPRPHWPYRHPEDQDHYPSFVLKQRIRLNICREFPSQWVALSQNSEYRENFRNREATRDFLWSCISMGAHWAHYWGRYSFLFAIRVEIGAELPID